MSGRIKIATDVTGSGLPRIGHLKIGTKVQRDGGKEYPTSLDHFIATGAYADLFKEAFGDKPTKVPIIFVSDDTRQVCYERFEAWTTDGKKIGSGDGETFSMFSDKDKDYITVPSTHELVQKNKASFKRVLTLKFVIPQIRSVFGHWEFTTRATKSTINQIIATFDSVKDQAGRVSAIPFDLVVSMAQSRKPNVVSRYPVVTLVPNIGAENLEKVSLYLGDLSFGKIGVLTEDKIAKLVSKEEPKQLEQPKLEQPKEVIETAVVVEKPKAEKKSDKDLPKDELFDNLD